MSVKNSCSVFFAFSRNIFFFPFFISFFHFYFTSQAPRFSLRFSLFFSYEFFSFSFFNSGKVTVDEIPSRFQAQFPCIHIRLIQMHLSIYITTVADNVSSRRMSRSAQVLVDNVETYTKKFGERIQTFAWKSWYLFNSTFYDINYISAHLFYNMQSVFRNRESSVVLLVIKYNKKIIYKTCHAVLQTAANNNRDLKIVDARNRIS